MTDEAKPVPASGATAGRASRGGQEAGPPKPKLASLDLERSVPVLATVLANRITSSGSLMFRKRHGLGSMEWKVLATLASGSGVTGAQISTIIGLDPGGVSRVLKAFAAQGIIRVERNARHSKYQSVSLTPKGRALHDEAILTALEREEMLLKPFSEKERLLLVDFLQRLVAQSRVLERG